MSGPYNLSDVGMSVTLFDYFSAVNVAMGEWFGPLLLVLSYFMIFSLVDKGDSLDANVLSLFVVSMLSVLLWGLGFVALTVSVVPLVLFLFSLGFKVFNS